MWRTVPSSAALELSSTSLVEEDDSTLVTVFSLCSDELFEAVHSPLLEVVEEWLSAFE
jgi:hypothetical protein